LSFTSPKGVNVSINGLTATGNVQLRYIELFDIGSMVLADKPLLGKYNLDKVAPLVTGGEFFLEVTQDGNKLNGSANLQVPVGNTQAENPNDMSLWTLDEDSTVWEQGELEGGNKENVNISENYYQCYFLSFGWTNIDWLYSLDGDKTAVHVKVPDGYNGTNSAVYAAFLTMPNTLASFDVYVEDGHYFTEHTGIAPIGYKMFVIFVSGDAQTGQFVYATKLVTIAANQSVIFTAADLRIGSIQQVIDAINGLYN
jgi:hypothetical protein